MLILTSGQGVLTTGRIAPELVTPTADESILRPRFRRDALPLRTSLQPRPAAYTVGCISAGGTAPKISSPLGEIHRKGAILGHRPAYCGV